MTAEELRSLDVARLTEELSNCQNTLQKYHSLYEKELEELKKSQDMRIEAQKQENSIKNSLRVIKSKIEAIKERMRSIKILLRAETLTI